MSVQTALAALLTAAAVACLYGARRRLISPRLHPAAAGAVLLGLSCWAWVSAAGAAAGLTLALLTPAPIAWLLVGCGARLRVERNQARPRPAAPATRTDQSHGQPPPMPPLPQRGAPTRAGGAHGRQPVTWVRLRRHLALFVVVVPVSAVAALYASVALARLLPGSQINRIGLALLLTPLLWGGAAYWASADARPARAAAGICLAGLAGALIAYLA